MPYTKAPEFDTYSQVEIPLISNYGIYDGSVVWDTPDYRNFINMVPEKHQNPITGKTDIFLSKRPGSSQYIAATGSSGEVRGMYFWEDQQRLFVAIENDIYVYTSGGTPVTTLSNVWSTTTGKVGFTEFLYDTGIVKIVAVDGTNLLTIDSSNTVVTSADGDLPAHVPSPVYVDGYLLLLKTNTADIYNSDLNDPTAWTPGNFITGEMLPDRAIELSRLNNYVLLFGTKSIEYFYNAAIESGSPFQRQESYMKYVGYIGGLASYGHRGLFFVGNMNDGIPEVYMLEESDIKKISSQGIRNQAESAFVAASTTLYGGLISTGGHDWYILNTFDGSPTYVYHLQTGIWSTWIYQNGAFSFGVKQVINAEATPSFQQFRCLFTRPGDRAVYQLSDTIYQDNSTNFNCYCQTDALDFGTPNQKVMNRLVVHGDATDELVYATQNITILCYDSNNGNTYDSPTITTTVDLNQELPSIKRLGRFRDRVIAVSYTANQPLRLKGFTANINKGTW